MKELWGYSKIKPLGRGRGGFHKKVKKKKNIYIYIYRLKEEQPKK